GGGSCLYKSPRTVGIVDLVVHLLPFYRRSPSRTILPFAHPPAAVHGQDDAGDEAGRVAAQEDGGVAAVLGPAGAGGQGLLGLEEGEDDRVVGRPGGHWRVDQARGEDVDADVVGGVAGRRQPAHAD